MPPGWAEPQTWPTGTFRVSWGLHSGFNGLGKISLAPRRDSESGEGERVRDAQEMLFVGMLVYAASFDKHFSEYLSFRDQMKPEDRIKHDKSFAILAAGIHGRDVDLKIIDLLCQCDYCVCCVNEIKRQEKDRERVSIKADPQPTLTFVYLMKSDRNGLIKIGHSARPEFRERTLQSEDPHVRLVYAAQTCKSVETRLHRMFENKRVRGEWFNLSDEDCGLAQRIIEGVEA